MLGSVRWNVALGLAGMLLTFGFSLGNNGFAVSCLRSLYAFAAFFVAGYLVRGALQLIAAAEPVQADPNVGTRVDLETPAADEDLNDLLKKQLEATKGNEQPQADGFVPLQPARLFKADDPDAEQLAEAVRRLAHDREE